MRTSDYGRNSSIRAHILHVIPELSRGGAERIATQLAAHQTAEGETVAVASSGGDLEAGLGRLGVTHFPVPLSRRSTLATLGAIPALASAVRQFRPDLIHAHNVRAAVATRVAVGIRPPALLTTVHGMAPSDYQRAAMLLRLVAPRVVACAPTVARSLTGAGFPPARIEVIVNGARLEPPGPERLAKAREVHLISGGPLIVGVGRLATQKRWDLLIAASAGLTDAAIVVAGEGPLRGPLEDAADRAGDRVRFLGRVDDVAALYGLATCAVLPSDWEGVPLSLLEALSLGVPIVASAVDGVVDLVSPDVGLLVPPGNSQALAAALHRVLDEPDLAASMRRCARVRSAAHTPEAMIGAYRQLYASLLR